MSRCWFHHAGSRGRSLQENSGSKAAATATLGMSRATIYRKIKAFGIA